MKVVGIAQMVMSATSKATIGAKTWQVCVLVTDPDSNHTLLVQDDSRIDFANCMVQVNTKNWDAVEARDSSYIHSVNGDNCFVGDIHYGDVTPPKDPTCTFFPDPFSGYQMPASATNCNYSATTTIDTPTTLNPGTYCGGIGINADTVLNKGLYVIRDGKLQINSHANVTGNGVTFLFTGDKLFDTGSMAIQIQTTGTINITPASAADAGQFAGFVFFLDQNTGGSNKKQGKVRIWNTTMNTSGILYLRGATMDIGKDAVLTVNPGSIVADFILPDKNGTLNLTGSLNSSIAVLNSMKKTGSASGGPVLVN